jgi:hypothetical protein
VKTGGQLFHDAAEDRTSAARMTQRTAGFRSVIWQSVQLHRPSLQQHHAAERLPFLYRAPLPPPLDAQSHVAARRRSWACDRLDGLCGGMRQCPEERLFSCYARCCYGQHAGPRPASV